MTTKPSKSSDAGGSASKSSASSKSGAGKSGASRSGAKKSDGRKAVVGKAGGNAGGGGAASKKASAASNSVRRAAILAAAARLFEHYGHSKTTIGDVAREAQIGVGTVYLEFLSKEEIVEALSVSTHDGVLEAMRVAAKRDRNHVDRFTAVLMARTQSFLEVARKGQHACELVQCSSNRLEKEGVRSAHQRFRDAELSLLTELLGDGQADGVFGAIDLASTAMLIQRSFASLSPPFILGAKVEDALRTASQLCELLLCGVIARKAIPAARRASARRRRLLNSE